MTNNRARHLQTIVKVTEVRKQRLANAAADARRKLAAAEEELDCAVKRVDLAQAALGDADKFLLQSPTGDQMLIWRNHCRMRRDEFVADKARNEADCAEAAVTLSQSVQALVRQDLRHDHLDSQAKQLLHRLALQHEARIDDEAQGCGPQRGTALQ